MVLVRPVLVAVLLWNAVPAWGIDFQRDIRPILADRCFACHGPDANHREAGLRLDLAEGVTSELEDGRQAIVPGQPERSELIRRIESTDPDVVMPPPDLNRPLSSNERLLLRQWIKEGAPYASHWAYVSPIEPELPSVTLSSWPRDPLDRFVLARLESMGLTPNPEADRRTWLRRISFVLTGLPPSPEEISAFEQDSSANAWEKQVDQRLASLRFGERMAQDWLDVARFADTLGYQVDANCFVWPWRDWVIRAFNQNLPYDQFVSWQVAGDLLPNATQDKRLATLFNRLHRQTNEGGSIEQEFRQEYVSDRVHTFGTAFLGLTLECSKCHDHKYDPLSQADYYSLCAMFGQIDECGLYPYSISTTAAEPSMRLLDPEQEREAARRKAAYDQASQTHHERSSEREQAFTIWLAKTSTIPIPVPSDYFPLDQIVDQRLPNGITGRDGGTMAGGMLTPIPDGVGGALEFDGDTILVLGGIKGITRHDPISVSVRLKTPERKERALLFHTGPPNYTLAADAGGFELLLERGKLRWSSIFLWPGCAASIETVDDFPVGEWVEVTVTYDGSSRAAGFRIYWNGELVPTTVLQDHLDKNITAEAMRVGARPRDDRGFAKGIMDELRIFRHPLSPLEVAELHQQGTGNTYLRQAQQGDPVATELLRSHYLLRVDTELAAARKRVSAALRHWEDDYLHQFPLIMTMKESSHPRPFYVLKRGDYASPDFERPVEPAAPSSIFPFDEPWEKNRLGLARWMTDPRHPLTSRVAVNRLWMLCFGQGIIVTQENFGLQGDPPSHPELLDTLAYDFSHRGWDVKRMLRRILLSATYRQSSASSSEKQQKDPTNRWLSRGPAFRLSGEAIRDQALVASGLFVEKIGGPSAKPWQPSGLWSEAGASGGDYTPDQGDGLHRRSLYTFRKRTAPPPSLLTLDAGSREICQPRRLTTNTPLQPLIFLNDAGFFECAQAMARRVAKHNADSQSHQLEFAFRLLTCRPPSAEELTTLQGLYDQQVQYYRDHAADAEHVCGSNNPHMAALTIVCSTLLTSDAALTTR